MRYSFALVMVLMGSVLSAATLVDLDPARAFKKLSDKSGRVSGALPPGWLDNSEWCKTWVDYSGGEDEGRPFLRMKVTKIDEGWMQIWHDLPAMDGEAYYRLSYTVKSPTGAGLEIFIRDVSPPYQTVWSHVPEYGGVWKTHSFEFRLGKHPRPVKLMMKVSEVGEVHLAGLKLEKLTKEELVEEIRKKYPEGGPKNLLRHTTFPLGLPCGWAVGRDNSVGDDLEVSPGERSVRVGGGHALSIKAKKHFVITSAPFEAPRVFEGHTLSFDVKGAGDGKVTVLADGKWAGSKTFKVTEPWTRVSLAFKPVLLAKAHAVRFEGTGQWQIDGMQVSSGEKLQEFGLAMPCEAHINVRSPARVVFEDEAALDVQLAVTGDLKRAAGVAGRRVDVGGGETPIEKTNLTADGRGQLSFKSTEQLGFGPIRLEVWAVDGKGERISGVSETVVYRLHRPRYWGNDAPNSPFGTHTNSTSQHNLMAKAVGINWVRLHDAGTVYAGWRYLEKEKGQWTFNDEPLQRYRRQNLKILGCLATSPNWATNLVKPHDGYFDQFYQPRDLADYGNYVKVVTSRYKGVIDTWDVWNEPWNHEWWAVRFDEVKGQKDRRLGYITSDQPEADFARMVDVAVKSTKATDPAMTVLGINSTTEATGRKWSAGIVAADGLKLPDVYCYHQYTAGGNLFPGDSVEKGLAAAMGPVIEKVGRIDKPVWMTEGSAVRHRIGTGFYKHTYPAGAGEDVWSTGDALCRYVISLMANGVSKVFLYSMHGHNTFGDGGEWRVLVTDEGYLHPSAAAHSAMAWLLEDTTFKKRIELKEGLWAYVFEGKGRTVAVLSTKPGTTAKWAALENAKVKIVDLFGNAVKDRAAVGPTIRYAVMEGTAGEMEGVLKR